MRNTVTCVGQWTSMRNTSCNLCVWCVCVWYVCVCAVCVCVWYVCVSGPTTGRRLRERADGGHPHESGGLRKALAAHPGHLRAPPAREGLHRILSWREFTPIMAWIHTYHDVKLHLSWHEFTPVMTWVHTYHDMNSHLSWHEFTPIMTWIHSYHDMSSLLSWHEFAPLLEVICFVGIVKVNVLCVSCRSYSVLCVYCSHWLCVPCV